YGQTVQEAVTPTDAEQDLHRRALEGIDQAPPVLREVLRGLDVAGQAATVANRGLLAQWGAVANGIDALLPEQLQRDQVGVDVPILGRIGVGDALLMASPAKVQN